MSDPLASAKAKLDRGDKHRSELDTVLGKFRKSQPYRITVKDDAAARETIHDVRYTGGIPVEWQPIIGDCLHNYRCALDHLVWALVCAHGTPNNKRQFPIACSHAAFLAAWTNCVGYVSRQGVKVAFEGLQPYKRANRPAGGPAWHPLWLLHRLDIVDKHRQMLDTMINAGFEFTTALPGIRVLNVSADLVRFFVPYNSGGLVQVKPNVFINIFIPQLDLGSSGQSALGVATALNLEDTIRDIGIAARQAVDRLERYCN